MKILLVFILLIQKTFSAQTIYIGVSDNCPYVCKSNKGQGYIIEVLNSILKEEKIKFQYVELPYLRQAQQLKSKQINLSLMFLKDIRFRSDMSTVGPPLGLSYLGYLTKLNQEIYFLSDIKGKRVVAPGGVVDEFSEKEILKFQELSGDKVMDRKVEMLNQNRADVLINDYSIILYYLKNSKMKFKYGPLSSLGHNKIVLVANSSDKKMQRLGQKIEKHLEKLRNNGELKKILDKYNLSDWSAFISR